MVINYKTNQNYFRVKDQDVIRVFYLHQISKLRLQKRIDTSFNIVLFSSGILCASIAILISEIFLPVRVIAGGSSAMFLLFSIIHRSHFYKLVIVTKEYSIIKVKVNSIEVEDTKNDVVKINKILKKQNENYSFSNKEMTEAPILKRRTLKYK